MAQRHGGGIDGGRRQILRSAAALAGWSAAAALGWPTGVSAQAQGGRGRGAGPGAAAPSGTQLVLLGTQGGPNVTMRRSQAAQAIVVDGRPYLVDCGYGTVRRLVEAGIGYGQVGQVFITHLHDDHTMDLPSLISLQWTGSRQPRTDVYGPPGTATMVDGALLFLSGNEAIRMTDEGRTNRLADQFAGHDLPAQAQPVQAFKDERVTVRCVENAHFKESAKAKMPHRSLAYRLDTATRSIVVSGDTAYSTNLVALAKGADLFVCEAMDVATHARFAAQAEAATKAGNPNSIARHIAETHVTTVDVGRMAAEAGVKTVVLSHLSPGSNNTGAPELPDTAYLDGVRQHFSGQIVLGRDLMVL